MSLEERTRARLTELEAGREKFISDAQRQLAALDAAIGEIRALLDPSSIEQNGIEADPERIGRAARLVENGTSDEPAPAETAVPAGPVMG